MAISNFFSFFLLFAGFFKYSTHFQSAKNGSDKNKTKVQIILQRTWHF